MSSITLWGGVYDTDYVDLPKTGGGTVRFSEGGGTVTWETIANQDVTIASSSPNYFVINNYTTPFSSDETYRVTWGSGGTEYICQTLSAASAQVYDGWYIGNLGIAGGTDTGEPFLIYRDSATRLVCATNQSAGSFHVKIERQTTSSATLITKSITANGTYSASDDSADGYSEVTVNVPTSAGNDFIVTLSEVNGVWTPDKTFAEIQSAYSNGKNIAIKTDDVSVIADGNYDNSDGKFYYTVGYYDYTANHYVIQWYIYDSNGVTDDGSGTYITTPTDTLNITTNNTYDVTNYASAVVNVPSGGSSKNVQTAQSTTRRNNTALGSIISLTCQTAGTYDVYWTCARSNTSQTWGSQLYINGTAYDTENTTWSNNVQNNHLTGVVLSANDTVAVYGRSRSGYYIYVPQLTIVQTA